MDVYKALLIQILRNQMADLEVACNIMERRPELYGDKEKKDNILRIAQTLSLLNVVDPPPDH